MSDNTQRERDIEAVLSHFFSSLYTYDGVRFLECTMCRRRTIAGMKKFNHDDHCLASAALRLKNNNYPVEGE